MLLGDGGTCVLTTCPGLHSTAGWVGFELATYRSQVHHPNHSATKPHTCLVLTEILREYRQIDAVTYEQLTCFIWRKLYIKMAKIDN